MEKLAVISIGVPLIITLNIIRKTTILTLGYYYGEASAFKPFIQQAVRS